MKGLIPYIIEMPTLEAISCKSVYRNVCDNEDYMNSNGVMNKRTVGYAVLKKYELTLPCNIQYLFAFMTLPIFNISTLKNPLSGLTMAVYDNPQDSFSIQYGDLTNGSSRWNSFVNISSTASFCNVSSGRDFTLCRPSSTDSILLWYNMVSKKYTDGSNMFEALWALNIAQDKINIIAYGRSLSMLVGGQFPSSAASISEINPQSFFCMLVPE